MHSKFLYPDKLKVSTERYKFFDIYANQKNDRFNCVKCNDVLIQPQQTECGCRFCFSCLDNFLKNNDLTCPGCGHRHSGNDKHIYDRAVEKEIFELQMSCVNANCKFSSKLRDLVEHLTKCDFGDEICNVCLESYPCKERNNHATVNCKMIKLFCKDCGLEMTNKEFDEHHRGIEGDLNLMCDFWTGICPYNCSEEINDNIKEHLSYCPNKSVECCMKEFGCTKVLPRGHMKDHTIDDVSDHMNLLMPALVSLREENARLNSEFNENNSKLRIEIDNLRQINSNLSKETLKLVEKIKTCEDNYCRLENEVNVLRKIGKCEKIRPLSVLHGDCTWKIDNIFEKIKDAKRGNNTEIVSDPFYSGCPGYKLCLKIYPNGNGVGLGSNISLYFSVMMGDYDDVISWPFREIISLSLLNNQYSANRTLHLKPDVNEVCYGRPKKQYNTAAGHPSFVSHAELLNGFVEKGAITVNGRVL